LFAAKQLSHVFAATTRLQLYNGRLHRRMVQKAFGTIAIKTMTRVSKIFSN